MKNEWFSEYWVDLVTYELPELTHELPELTHELPELTHELPKLNRKKLAFKQICHSI